MTNGLALANSVSSKPNSASRPTNESAARDSNSAFRRVPTRTSSLSDHSYHKQRSGGTATAASLPALRGFASRQCLDVGGCKRLAAHRPVAALYLVDEHPGEPTQVLSLDAHHGICDSLNDGLLLLLREDPFDELDVDQWHWTLLSRRET